MPEVLPDFALIALAFLAIAFALAARLLVKALFSPLIAVVGHIPGVGSALSGVLAAIERTLVGACGAIYNGGDKLLGWSFHQLASQANWLWREIRAHSLIVAEIAALVGALAHGYHWLRAEVRTLTHGAHSVGKRLGHFERELHGIEHGVRTFEKDFTKVLNHEVLPELRSLDKELTHIESQVIPDIRAIAHTAENDVSALRKWVTDHVPLVGTIAFAGAVAWALGRLGVGWTRCSNWGKIGNRFCGLGSDLIDALLLGTLAVLGGVSLVGLATEMVSLADTFVPIITGFFTEMAGVTRRTAQEQGFV